MSKFYTFEVHTYGADTPHCRKRYLPLRLKAQTSDEACSLAKHRRPQSHVSMCHQTK